MQEKKNILTYEGLRKYEDELHDLKVVKRQRIVWKKTNNRQNLPEKEKIIIRRFI